MNRSLKIGLACAFGAFIGSIVALELNQYWWWLGLLAGGGFGYLSYEFKTFLWAIPVAWNSVIHWHLDRKFWKNFVYFFMCQTSVYSTAFLAFAFLMYIASLPEDQGTDFFLFTIKFILPFPLLIMAIVFAIHFSYGTEEDIQKNRVEIKNFLTRANPFIVYFYYVPKYVSMAIWFVVRHIPSLFASIGRGFAKIGLAFPKLFKFVWTVFKFIHSEERVLCAFDAAVGAGIGFAYHNALVGMLAGGIFGVLNYEILSKRVFKLAPEKIKP